MTKKILTSYTTLIIMASMAVVLAIAGALTVHASEVTGTLSSDSSTNSPADGDIGGTVTSGDSEADGNIGGTVTDESGTSGNLDGTVVSPTTGSTGSGSSGGGGSSGGRVSLVDTSSDSDDSDTPPSSVLGAATNNTVAQGQTPRFPNAGVEPDTSNTERSLWSSVVTLLRNIVSF